MKKLTFHKGGKQQPQGQGGTPQEGDAYGPGQLPPEAARPYLPGTPGVDATDERAEPIAQQEMAEQPESEVYVASQWKLMWWRFRKNKLALLGAATMLVLYTVALFAPFFAPFQTTRFNAQYTYAPPQRLHLTDTTEDGSRVFRPWVTGFSSKVNPESLKREFTPDETKKVPVRFFAEGFEHKILGIFTTNRHLIGPVNPQDPMYLLGADKTGFDLLSRLIYGARISLSIGLVGVFLSLFLGVLLGGVSGYYGGTVDTLIQRFIEFLIAIPTLPLWLGLAAALPPGWSPLKVYFGITIILSLIGWTGLARVVRGRFLSLREEDFVTAARLDGSSELRIILRHMLPSFASHIIASLTLAIPGVILAETALSFLGLGLRAPIVSWGVLLQGAQNVRAIATAPWLLIPAIMVMITVMALYFLGDGLRDAADPYAA